MLFHRLDVGIWEVDLVDDRDDRQALLEGEMDVGDGLSLDALSGVDDEQRALAGRQAARNLVGEIDVSRCIEQVKSVVLTVLRTYFIATGCALMVIPRSRSRSIESSNWSCLSRSAIVPVLSSKRSDRVVLPWSMCAMMQKLRVRSMDIRKGGGIS